MTLYKLGAGACGTLCILACSAVQAEVIDFEGFSAGTIIDDDIAGVAVSAFTVGGSSPDVAVVFDTDSPTGGDTDLSAPFIQLGGDSAEFSPGNVLILQENDPCSATACDDPDDNAAGGTFTFEFDLPVILNSIDFFDIEANEAGSSVEGFGILISATDEDPASGLLGQWEVFSTGGNNTWGSTRSRGRLRSSNPDGHAVRVRRNR